LGGAGGGETSIRSSALKFGFEKRDKGREEKENLREPVVGKRAGTIEVAVAALVDFGRNGRGAGFVFAGRVLG
jgi:hypothetical protein